MSKILRIPGRKGWIISPRDGGHVVAGRDEEVEIFLIMQVREPGKQYVFILHKVPPLRSVL